MNGCQDAACSISPNSRIMTRAADTSFCRINLMSRPNTAFKSHKVKLKPLKDNPSKALFIQSCGNVPVHPEDGPVSPRPGKLLPDQNGFLTRVPFTTTAVSHSESHSNTTDPASPSLCLCLSKVCQGRTHDLMPHSDANANVCCKGTGGSESQRLRLSQSMPLACRLICLSIPPLSLHLQQMLCPAEPTVISVTGMTVFLCMHVARLQRTVL